MLAKLSTVQKAFAALIVANIIWGAASPIFKLSLQNIPPFTLAFLRFFIASIVLIPILRGKISFKLKTHRDLYLLIANAVLGITANIIFFFLGLRLTLAMNAPVIASSAPILTLVLAIILLREHFHFRKFFGVLLGFGGILIIIFEPLYKQGLDASVTGNLLLLLATLGAVGGTLTGHELFRKYRPMALTFWTFVIGSASFFPLAAYEYMKSPNLYALLDWRGYLGIIFGAFFSSATAYTLFNWGLSKISATDTALFTYIDPVAGTILAFFLLHEPITTPFIVGAILIFGGIGIAEGRLQYHPLNKLQTPAKLLPIGNEPVVSANTQAVVKKLFQNRAKSGKIAK